MIVRLVFSVVLCAWVSASPLSPGKVCTPGTCTTYTQRDLLQEIVDDRVETHADVWTCDDFTPGSDPFPACEWDIRAGPHWGENNILGTDDPAGSGTALRIFYPEGSYVGHPDQEDMRSGSQWYHHNYGNYETLNLEYDVYFSDNFDFVIGGKLPGFYGGEGSCSGGVTSDCFSSRFMWRSEGRLEIYGYLPAEECVWFCDDICPLTVCDFNYGHSFGRGAASLTVGRWHTIRQYIKVNDVGSSNGVFRYYLDGSLRWEITGLTIRETSSVYPSELFFSTFFGGSSPDYASTADCYAYFRRIRIFT